MKKILMTLVMLFTTLSIQPASINGSLIDIFGAPIETWIVFKPAWTPLAAGGNVVVSPTRKVFSTNGVFSVSYIAAGQYTVSFLDVEKDICIMVPTNNSAYTFNYLASLCTNLPSVVSLVTNTSPIQPAAIFAEDVLGGQTAEIFAELDSGSAAILFEP